MRAEFSGKPIASPTSANGRPSKYPSPEQLVLVGYKSKRSDFMPFVYPIELASYRARATSFSAFAASRRASVNLVKDGAPTGVYLASVPVDYFATFGTLPLLGRTFVPGEDQPGADRVVVLSHRLWREQFGGDLKVLNREVILAGSSYRVVGVLPGDFRPPIMHGGDLYQPLVLTVDPARPVSPDYLAVVARLRPGVTLEQARAELATIKFEVSARYTGVFSDREPQLQALTDPKWTGASESHWVLLAAVGCLYAIACANAANLMLARVHGRRRELCIRLAIGCGRVQLVRLVLAEALVLTGIGGACGLLIAQWVFPVLLWLANGGADSALSFGLDWRAVAFATGLSALTSLLVSLPPAWRIAQADVTGGLKEGGQALGESRPLRTLRAGLVMMEAALAVVLLIGAGLMVRTVQRLQNVDRGIDPANKVSVYLSLPARPTTGAEARRALHLAIAEKLRAVPRCHCGRYRKASRHKSLVSATP